MEVSHIILGVLDFLATVCCLIYFYTHAFPDQEQIEDYYAEQISDYYEDLIEAIENQNTIDILSDSGLKYSELLPIELNGDILKCRVEWTEKNICGTDLFLIDINTIEFVSVHLSRLDTTQIFTTEKGEDDNNGFNLVKK